MLLNLIQYLCNEYHKVLFNSYSMFMEKHGPVIVFALMQMFVGMHLNVCLVWNMWVLTKACCFQNFVTSIAEQVGH